MSLRFIRPFTPTWHSLVSTTLFRELRESLAFLIQTRQSPSRLFSLGIPAASALPLTKEALCNSVLGLFVALMVAIFGAGSWFSSVSLLAQEIAATRLPMTSPESVGLDTTQLSKMDGLIARAIEAGKMPGCVVCVGRQGHIAWLKAYGNKQVEPDAQPMTIDTVFDMASITKPVATATSIMKLVEAGQLRISQKVTDIFPEFGAHGKDAITIRDLLIHQSGLIPDNALSDYLQGPEIAWQKICDLKLTAPVGEQFKYSDVNFIVLGKIVEQLSGLSLREFVHQELFAPLGMLETGFVPNADLKRRAAPTEQREGKWIQGEVHDPRAYELSGVAGHAGLFSTAADLAVYAQMMLGKGTLRIATNDLPRRILSPATVEMMTAANPVSTGTRGLGWDKQTSYSSNRGDLLSPQAFGHGGFTGTVLWIDPESDLFFIFLSNRVHPNGKGLVNPLAGQIANLVGAAVWPTTVSPLTVSNRNEATSAVAQQADAGQGVLCGIDVLVRDGFKQLAGKKVGLITNHTGRDIQGNSTVRLFHEAKNIELVALFSPEHGFEGNVDIPLVKDAQDKSTGLKVYSLYGETRRPTAEMLAKVDVLVFDIQDIGSRFYTYVSTMGEAMHGAAAANKAFMVLDRPNPINGLDIAGPMLDPGFESFVGFHNLPVRHGMTAGELARMFRAELALDLELEVLQCENWQRAQYWESTQLTWVNPSPNMRSLNQAVLYPGMGLWEMTNVSVGRGTDTPFEILGAPWFENRQLAHYLNGLGLPGAIFYPIEFTPDSSKFAGERCKGISISIIDRSCFDPVRCGLAIAHTLKKLHAEEWDTKNVNRLLGNRELADAILQGADLPRLSELANQGVKEFRQRREHFLLY